MSSWSFDQNILDQIREILFERIKAGVKVTICTRPWERNSLALDDLAKKGALIYGHERFHAKFIIVDDTDGLLMTSNWTQKGLETGFEAGIEIEPGEMVFARALINDLIGICPWTYRGPSSLKDLQGDIRFLKGTEKNAEMVDIVIEDTYEERPNSYQVDSIEKMEKFEPPHSEVETENKKIRKIHFRWIVEPPHLPAKAEAVMKTIEKEVPLTKDEKEELETKKENAPLHKMIKEEVAVTEPFPLFRVGKNRFVVISKWDELPDAVRFAKNNDAKIVLK